MLKKKGSCNYGIACMDKPLLNDDEHIKEDFGFNRLNEQFKTCTKCRTKKVNINTLPDALTDKIYQFKTIDLGYSVHVMYVKNKRHTPPHEESESYYETDDD